MKLKGSPLSSNADRKKALSIVKSYLTGVQFEGDETIDIAASKMLENPDFIRNHKAKRDQWLQGQKDAKAKLGIKKVYDGYVPDFLNLRGRQEFEDWDENLATYPADMKRGELFKPGSVRKSRLTGRGKSKVGSPTPIAILTARHQNSCPGDCREDESRRYSDRQDHCYGGHV